MSFGWKPLFQQQQSMRQSSLTSHEHCRVPSWLMFTDVVSTRYQKKPPLMPTRCFNATAGSHLEPPLSPLTLAAAQLCRR